MKKQNIQYTRKRAWRLSTKPMLRSRFFPATCSCLKTVDELFNITRDICVYASQRLGTGHSEKTYESVIINELYKRRIPTLRQVKYYSIVDGNVVETGICDIEISGQLIVELKSNLPNITRDHMTQAKRYLRSAREKYPDTVLMCCVILFQKNGDVAFWKAKSTPTTSRVDVSVEHSDIMAVDEDHLLPPSDENAA